MSHITIPNKALREKFQYLLRFGLHVANGNSFGIAAAQAAYAHGEEWYQELMAYLTGNIEFLDEALKKWIPQVTLVRPESTYIPLLDMEGLHMDSQELWDFMIQEAGAALHAGRTFGAGGERFMRINIGTQRANLELFVERLRAALQRSAPARIG